jgi:hypothetical protein
MNNEEMENSASYHPGPPEVQPEERLLLMGAPDWEIFIDECVRQLQKEGEYVQVHHLGGAGDKGRDVCGYTLMDHQTDPRSPRAVLASSTIRRAPRSAVASLVLSAALTARRAFMRRSTQCCRMSGSNAGLLIRQSLPRTTK